MALERRNPLPPGRYWLDVFGSNRARFAQWVKTPSVHVDSTQSFESDPPRNWYLFTVNAPTEIDNKVFGYPTIAGVNVKSSDDTASKPDLPKDPIDNLSDNLGKIGSFATLGLGIVALGLLAALIASRKG